jgi:O-acetyl-ADP-ribose deacetylase (regulator of RNase III)
MSETFITPGARAGATNDARRRPGPRLTRLPWPGSGDIQSTHMDAFSLQLVATTEPMAAAFRSRFRAFPGVDVVLGRWEALPPHDCFVTAGNCFGLMSAGIDAAVVRQLGLEIESAVQLRIMNEFLGEQPVGTAFLLETGSPRVPFLCHAPTMRVPGDITGTDNVYRATRAALLSVYHHNRSSEQTIRSVVFPAFGAGFGGVAPDEVARQMAVAWKLFRELPYPPNWDRVIDRERLICWDGAERRVRG